KSDLNLKGTNHTVAVALNKTGFQPVVGTAGFHILSAIQLAAYEGSYFGFSTPMIEIEPLDENGTAVNATILYPGENFTITVDIKNTATTKQYLNVSFGQGNNVIAPFTTIQELNASNADFISYTYNVSVLQVPDVGFQSLNFTIAKNGSNIVWGMVPVYVFFPITLKNVNYPSHIVDGGWYNVSFKVKNENPSHTTSAKILFQSENLETTGPDVFNFTDIAPGAEVEGCILIKLKEDAEILPQYHFQLKTIWNNHSLGGYLYAVFFKPPVEVLSISGPIKPLQNQPLYFSISIQNNRHVPVVLNLEFIRILDNGQPVTVMVKTISVNPGTGDFVYQLNTGIDNPWDFGEREYKIIVKDGGRIAGFGTIRMNIQLSVENVIVGYILVFAIVGVLILLALHKKRQISSMKR
nr:hypothetical protein [Candidatus Sigynarchaeota archaeon]